MFSVNTSGLKQKSRFKHCDLHKCEPDEAAGRISMPTNQVYLGARLWAACCSACLVETENSIKMLASESGQCSHSDPD